MRADGARAVGLIAVLLAAGLAQALTSDRVAAGPEPPTLLATAYNTQRKLVLAPDGTLYAAITVNASGAPSARVLTTRDGVSWSALPPPPTSGNASDRTTLGIDSAGRLHLAWTDVLGSNRQVYYARYEGGAWVGRIQLSHSPGYAGFPSVAVDREDRVHVAWYATDGTNYQVYYRRLEASGWTTERALTFTLMDATNPAIALGPDGFVHIAWARLSSRGFTEIAYLRLEGDTIAETRGVSLLGADSLSPSIVVDSSRRVHIAWDSAGRIQYIQRATNWSSIGTVSPPSLSALNPSLALDALSRLYAVWEASDGAIYSQVWNGSWSGATALSSGGTNHHPSVRWSQFDNPLCGPAGGIDVVWTEDLNGTRRLEYTRIEAPSGCPQHSAFTPGVLLAAIPALAVAGAIVVYVIHRRRNRPPKGGGDPEGTMPGEGVEPR